MNTALVKPSKIVKGITSVISAHLNAVERAREIYLAGMRRLEADYFDRIKRATEIVTSDDTTAEPASAEAPPVSEASTDAAATA